MKLTVMAGEDRFVVVDVEPTEVVEGVKALVEVETGVPVDNQSLLFQGAVLANASQLDRCGVRDSDILVMIDQGGPPGGGTQGAVPRAAAEDTGMSQHADGSAVDPQAFRAGVLGNRALFARLCQVNLPLARAIEMGDIEEMQKGLRAQRDLAKEQERKTQEEQELLSADPFDPVAQAKIEERIRQENIDLNLEVALEHSPEQFVAVHMLYVDMAVNGHPIKAFIDSGAQQTIMSLSCAERCGLMRLLDKRFHGMAVGVGTSKIVGIIHSAPLKIGESFYTCRISVLENLNTDFLFGLDMLRRHQCSIDLQANVLRVGVDPKAPVTVPFLAEKDCPQRDEAAMEKLAAEQMGLGGSADPAPPSLKQEESRKTGESSGDKASPIAPNTSTRQTGQGSASAPAAPPAAAGAVGGAAPGAVSPASSNQASRGALASVRPSQAGPPPGTGLFESKVAKLVELGFTRDQVEQALTVTNGNEEEAAGLLFGGF